MRKTVLCVLSIIFVALFFLGCADGSVADATGDMAGPSASPMQEKEGQEPIASATANPGREEGPAASAKNGQGPEEVINQFIRAVAALDAEPDGVLECFAVDELVEGFDSGKMADYLQVDPENPAAQPPTKEERLSEITGDMQGFFAGLWLDTEKNELAADGDTINDPGSYSGISVRRIDIPVPETVKAMEAKFREQAERYGAQDRTVRTALLEFNGKTYYCGFDLLLYPGGWKINGLHSGAVLPVSASIVTFPVAEDEYAEMIAEDAPKQGTDG